MKKAKGKLRRLSAKLRTLRKELLNCLVLKENEGKPTQDLMYRLRKAKEALTGKSPSYLTGKEKAKEHKEKLKKLLKKGKGYVDEWMGKKKGGSIKKNGPVRPIHIPWDSQKKKKGGTVHPRNTGVAVPQKGLGSLIPKLAQQAYGKPKEKK